jgi:hypothetical protein
VHGELEQFGDGMLMACFTLTLPRRTEGNRIE